MSVCVCVRELGEHFFNSGGGWSEEALIALEGLTHSASWKAVMLRVVFPAEHTVTIVDTNSDQVRYPLTLLITVEERYFFLLQDINIVEQLVNRGFAKWAEHTAKPHPPLSMSHRLWEDLQSESNSVGIGYVSLPRSYFPAFVMAVHSINLLYIMVCTIHVLKEWNLTIAGHPVLGTTEGVHMIVAFLFLG